MPRTPDRMPGVSLEEGIILEDNGIEPTVAGEVRFSSGVVKMRDSIGAYNPRSSDVAPLLTSRNTGETLISRNTGEVLESG